MFGEVNSYVRNLQLKSVIKSLRFTFSANGIAFLLYLFVCWLLTAFLLNLVRCALNKNDNSPVQQSDKISTVSNSR